MMHNAVHVEDRYFVTIHDVRTAASISVIDWHQQRCSRKSRIAGTLAPKRGVHRLSASYRIRSGGSKGAGGRHAPPRWRPEIFFASILILLLSRWAVGIVKWLFVEGFYFPTGLCLSPFAVSVLCIACRLQQQVL